MPESLTGPIFGFISDFKETLLVILGWLLGVLSPLVVSHLKERKDVVALKTALVTELQELQYRLVLIVFQIEAKYGTIDHKYFEWAQSVLAKYRGINSADTLIKTLGPILRLSKEEMMRFSELNMKTAVQKSGLALKKHELSFLQTNISLLQKFDPVTQALLLEIKTRTGYMNETADEAVYYFRLSFSESISPDNYRIATENMISSYKMYATQAREVVEIIKKTKLSTKNIEVREYAARPESNEEEKEITVFPNLP